MKQENLVLSNVLINFELGTHLSLTTNPGPLNVHAHDTKLLFPTWVRSQDQSIR